MEGMCPSQSKKMFRYIIERGDVHVFLRCASYSESTLSAYSWAGTKNRVEGDVKTQAQENEGVETIIRIVTAGVGC